MNCAKSVSAIEPILILSSLYIILSTRFFGSLAFFWFYPVFFFFFCCPFSQFHLLDSLNLWYSFALFRDEKLNFEPLTDLVTSVYFGDCSPSCKCSYYREKGVGGGGGRGGILRCFSLFWFKPIQKAMTRTVIFITETRTTIWNSP